MREKLAWLYKLLHSQVFGLVARIERPKWLVQWMIQTAVDLYQIDLSEVAEPILSFKSLDAFFVRHLNPQCRPFCQGAQDIAAPSDGLVQQYGDLLQDKMIQAKGFDYSVEQLIPSQYASRFKNGRYITFYLSPKDCHLTFAPLSGQVIASCHVPGSLHLVRESYLEQHPGVYTHSERLVTFLQTERGMVALVTVGAIRVGNISTTYDASIRTNRILSRITEKKVEPPVSVTRGDHLATFHLGSTVILIFEPGAIEWAEDIAKGQSMKYGTKIAHLLP
jgi:phosphatidylserine decarboxylase